MQTEIVNGHSTTVLTLRAQRLQSRAEQVTQKTPFLPGEAKQLINEMAAVIVALSEGLEQVTPYLDEAQ